MRTIVRERLIYADPRLRRYVLHDSESWRYRFSTEGLTISSVEHERTLPILDQGQVGSCTAEAGFGTLGTAPYYTEDLAALIAKAFGSFDQDGAYRFYSAEETLDKDGPYPPNDNGSTGLTCAKVLQQTGLIAGYQHTFSLSDALKALTQYPLITGTSWYQSMFKPDAEGIVTVDRSSSLAGGHEYEVVGYDSARDLVHFANSWGTSWGQEGYFWMSSSDWGQLLSERGDVTVFTPLTAPAPVPASDPDAELAAVAKRWVALPHTGSSREMQQALQTWLTETGRM